MPTPNEGYRNHLNPQSQWARSLPGQANRQASMKRRQAFVACFEDTLDIDASCIAAGVTRHTYEKWRLKFRDFAAVVDAIRVGDRDKLRDHWDGTFADFRLRFFGNDSPWFHLRMIQALEHGEPGSITLILLPPEHGKTTTLEDFCSYKLAVDPSFRITYASERIDHAMKVLGRVMNRMERDGPYPEYVGHFGPFAPPGEGSGRKTRQTWSKKMFSVFKRADRDERDYSMVALGIGAAVAGTRTDLLVLDDIQSLKSLNQTDDIVETIRQDWLSRPGSKGRTVIVGTRVGDGDVYEKLIELGIIDNLIEFPAYTGAEWPEPVGARPKEDKDNLPPEGCNLLWPERYSRQEYLIMRVNAGEMAWLRNYMQRPKAAGDQHFTDAMIAEALDPMRPIFADPPDDVAECVTGLDPGYGTNATVTCGMTPERLHVLTWQLDYNLTNTEEILEPVALHAEQFDLKSRERPCGVTEVVIEEKAFQKGLFEDKALKVIKLRYGFNVTGHETGWSKYDPNFGIPAMARSFRRNEIVIPGADDPATQAALELLKRELTNWKPYKRGTRLKQDLVMALWFCWMRWQARREHLKLGHAAEITATALPLKPTMLVLGGVK